MNLFSADLYRNFALGFVAGAFILGIANFNALAGQIESPAHAAAPIEAPQADGAFTIEPIEAAR